MTEHDRDDDLRARLHATDPASSLPPADPAGVARLLEDTMSHDTDTLVRPARRTGARDRGPLTWLVAAAAVLIIAGAGTFAVLRGTGPDTDSPVADGATGGATGGSAGADPAVLALSLPAAAAGRCMVPSAETLAGLPVAFEGTVESMDGGTVVLEPSRTYAGPEADRVEVSAPGDSLQDLVGAPDFQVGETYLVAATRGEVALCGISGPATPQLEALYDEAFAG